MPEAAFCILMALIEYGGRVSVHQMTASSGYEVSKYMRMLQRMTELGWVVKPYAGRWIITERGKIAVAIETGRRTKSASAGRRLKKVGARAFIGALGTQLAEAG